MESDSPACGWQVHIAGGLPACYVAADVQCRWPEDSAVCGCVGGFWPDGVSMAGARRWCIDVGWSLQRLQHITFVERSVSQNALVNDSFAAPLAVLFGETVQREEPRFLWWGKPNAWTQMFGVESYGQVRRERLLLAAFLSPRVVCWCVTCPSCY